jgi:hypothetical protein
LTAHNQSIENAQGIFKGKGHKLARAELSSLLQRTLPKKLLHAGARATPDSNRRNAYRPLDELKNAHFGFELLAHENGYGVLHGARLLELLEGCDEDEERSVRSIEKLLRLPKTWSEQNEVEYYAFFFSVRLRESTDAYHVNDEGAARKQSPIFPSALVGCPVTCLEYSFITPTAT